MRYVTFIVNGRETPAVSEGGSLWLEVPIDFTPVNLDAKISGQMHMSYRLEVARIYEKAPGLPMRRKRDKK